MTDDLVVLIDADGRPDGTAPRGTVHGPHTPLHLAFSCHLIDSGGRILMTRRALSKTTWPGVWTNSFCGHPRPGEDIEDAVRRYAPRELGLDITDVVPALPEFRYRAVDAGGVVENEICPVFRAHPVGTPQPNPAEVMDMVWAPIDDVWESAQRTPWVFSPWFVDQVHALGPRPYLEEES
ncbi:isopentenyl-diphosphate Delta-isomerase [Gordonia sp. SID5947]|uniref:isopentenyl-diphosphate Delta-isomerase n=1 Tax=Gordonia sp. SID5947 TaxID=2690315 RepID=UPI00136E3CF2|nr:isopentenyl-diphosphate Delta-isomerase [Gordonia sp. SID5947]MYR07339.1 isopentenyl-diphosphate Delta-isomerase [Gordonia sp. SID5947]